MIKEQTPTISKIRAIESIISGDQTVMGVAASMGVARATVYRWIDRYNNSETLERKPTSGRPPKVSTENAEKLLKIIEKPASAYGYETDFWNTRRISQISKKKLNISISMMGVHRILKKFEYSYRKPEARYYEACSEAQSAWSKSTVPKIKKIIKKHKAILYFEDESNIQLTPVISKTWAPIGTKITQKRTGNKGSLSAISAISNSGSLIFNVYCGKKRFNADDIVKFLQQMLKHHPRRHLVVVMDQAPCHKSKKVRDFYESQKRLHVFFLPPRSPELNPDEKVWRHLKHQDLKSHTAKNTKELKKLTQKKLKKMAGNKKLLEGIYHTSEGAKLFG
jgi:transposase